MPDTDSVEDRLRQAGWRQGSLLAASVSGDIEPLTWVHPAEQAASPLQRAWKAEIQHAKRDRAGHVRRSAKAGDRLVVISHTCDIVKAPNEFPQIDVALAFETENITTITEAGNLGSARFFRLSPVGVRPSLILDFRWRTFLDKGVLLQQPPDQRFLSTNTDDRPLALQRWLGRRFSRPVLSDEDVDTVSRPVQAAWRQFIEDDPDAAARCSNEYNEFRYRRHQNGTLTLYLLSGRETPDVTLALEIQGVLEPALKPHHASVTVALNRLSYHTFTLADQLVTQQIDLEWSSYEETGDADSALAAE